MTLSNGQPDLAAESLALREAWMRHEDAFLKDYLVSSVEDPRIHFPSILSRGLLVDYLRPECHRELILAEYQFGICMSYLLRTLQRRPSFRTRSLLLEALEKGESSFQSIPIPVYFSKTWRQLREDPGQALNYIDQALQSSESVGPAELAPLALACFQNRWCEVFSKWKAAPISVMEAACGSANDYRFMDAFGMSSIMTYHGFDICPKNIANARQQFPGVRFEVGNVFEIPAETGSVDYFFVHDLFEHLSIQGMHQGLREVCRVTRGMACLCFFNMADRADHVVQPKDGYHWNRLSLERVLKFLEPLCREVQVIHTGRFLQHAFGCGDYHNPGSYTLVLNFDSN